jgi:hypothetical protein
MKRIFNTSLILVLAGSFIAFAQQKNPTASFETESHDFGKINEADGPATFQFNFTNTGSEPLIISDVKASCGCTKPKWSKEPVVPGGKGFITVSFNPSGRPGHFDKIITVTSNTEPPTQQLKISGEVIPKVPVEVKPKVQTIEDQYPNKIEGLRLKSNQIAMNTINPGKKATQTLDVYNSTDQPMKVSFYEVPKHIEIKITPDSIQPKGKATIEVTYDASSKNDWGFIWDRVKLKINNKENGSDQITISSNIKEDFSQLTDEQKKNAPKIEFNNLTFNFDTIKAGDKADHIYTFKNTGKSDLLIRKVTPGCGCTVAKLDNQVIKPGDSGKISANFNSAGKNGSTSKTITVISNDPSNPSVTLWINGFIKQ